MPRRASDRKPRHGMQDKRVPFKKRKVVDQETETSISNDKGDASPPPAVSPTAQAPPDNQAVTDPIVDRNAATSTTAAVPPVAQVEPGLFTRIRNLVSDPFSLLNLLDLTDNVIYVQSDQSEHENSDNNSRSSEDAIPKEEQKEKPKEEPKEKPQQEAEQPKKDEQVNSERNTGSSGKGKKKKNTRSHPRLAATVQNDKVASPPNKKPKKSAKVLQSATKTSAKGVLPHRRSGRIAQLQTAEPKATTRTQAKRKKVSVDTKGKKSGKGKSAATPRTRSTEHKNKKPRAAANKTPSPEGSRRARTKQLLETPTTPNVATPAAITPETGAAPAALPNPVMPPFAGSGAAAPPPPPSPMDTNIVALQQAIQQMQQQMFHLMTVQMNTMMAGGHPTTPRQDIHQGASEATARQDTYSDAQQSLKNINTDGHQARQDMHRDESVARRKSHSDAQHHVANGEDDGQFPDADEEPPTDHGDNEAPKNHDDEWTPVADDQAITDLELEEAAKSQSRKGLTDQDYITISKVLKVKDTTKLVRSQKRYSFGKGFMFVNKHWDDSTQSDVVATNPKRGCKVVLTVEKRNGVYVRNTPRTNRVLSEFYLTCAHIPDMQIIDENGRVVAIIPEKFNQAVVAFFYISWGTAKKDFEKSCLEGLKARLQNRSYTPRRLCNCDIKLKAALEGRWEVLYEWINQHPEDKAEIFQKYQPMCRNFAEQLLGERLHLDPERFADPEWDTEDDDVSSLSDLSASSESYKSLDVTDSEEDWAPDNRWNGDPKLLFGTWVQRNKWAFGLEYFDCNDDNSDLVSMRQYALAHLHAKYHDKTSDDDDGGHQNSGEESADHNLKSHDDNDNLQEEPSDVVNESAVPTVPRKPLVPGINHEWDDSEDEDKAEDPCVSSPDTQPETSN